MNKRIFGNNAFYIFAIAAIALFTIGCSDDSEPVPHTDPAFLVGTWSNTVASFTINEDFTFTCDLTAESMLQKPGRVAGRIDSNDSNLGPNDYFIRDMTTSGSDDDFPGNEYLIPQLGRFKNLLATLDPNPDKTEFTFKSKNPAAAAFFARGGAYIKQPQNE